MRTKATTLALAAALMFAPVGLGACVPQTLGHGNITGPIVASQGEASEESKLTRQMDIDFALPGLSAGNSTNVVIIMSADNDDTTYVVEIDTAKIDHAMYRAYVPENISGYKILAPHNIDGTTYDIIDDTANIDFAYAERMLIQGPRVETMSQEKFDREKALYESVKDYLSNTTREQLGQYFSADSPENASIDGYDESADDTDFDVSTTTQTVNAE